MTTEKKSFDWIKLIVIALLMIFGFYIGYQNNTFTKKQEASIALQAILTANRDSAIKEANRLKEENNKLKVSISEANKKVTQEIKNVMDYKKKYNDLKSSISPNPCDTFVLFITCDSLLQEYDSLVANLQLVNLSRKEHEEKLQLENSYLTQANTVSGLIIENQNKELTVLRKKVRIRGIMNYTLGGGLVGAIVAILII